MHIFIGEVSEQQNGERKKELENNKITLATNSALSLDTINILL